MDQVLRLVLRGLSAVRNDLEALVQPDTPDGVTGKDWEDAEIALGHCWRHCSATCGPAGGWGSYHQAEDGPAVGAPQGQGEAWRAVMGVMQVVWVGILQKARLCPSAESWGPRQPPRVGLIPGNPVPGRLGLGQEASLPGNVGGPPSQAEACPG